MIKARIDNEMLTLLLSIERTKERFGGIRVPIELAKPLKVSNRTIINWCAALVNNGFLVPDFAGERIRSYSMKEV